MQYAGKQDRSVEDLKGRYYSIARQLMISREGNQEDIENYTLIKAPYDANHERYEIHVSHKQNSLQTIVKILGTTHCYVSTALTLQCPASD